VILKYGQGSLVSSSLLMCVACIHGGSLNAYGKDAPITPLKADAASPSEPSGSEEGHWHHGPPGRRGGMGGRLGFELAEILMIPSLTKDQQARIRSLYVSFRQRQQSYMNGRLTGRNDPNEDSRGNFKNARNSHRRADQSANIGGEILAGLVDQKKDGSDDLDANKEVATTPSAVIYSGGNAKGLKSRQRDFAIFNSKLLALLTTSQRKELRDIGLKVGSPDYYSLNDQRTDLSSR
jgi:hypothetical protein